MQNDITDQWLTVMIDGIDEPQTNIGMVVGDENHIKELLTFRIKFPQLSIDGL